MVVERHPTLWLADGNIIIRVPSPAPEDGSAPPKQILYRLHKTILMMHATFFEDLWHEDINATAMEAASDQIDGVPAMDVFDKPEDFEAFISAIYVPKCVSALLTLIPP